MRNFVLCTIAVFVVMFGVYISREVPGTLANPWKYRLVRAKLDIMYDLGVILDVFGLISDRNTYDRELFDYLMAKAPEPDPREIKVYNDEFDGVKVRMYEPVQFQPNRPGLVYVHGGGFRFLGPKGFDGSVVQYVKRLGVVAMSIDYRLAPDYPAPIPWQDCEKAARYFFTNAARWGVDPSRIGIAGDSAGGNVAVSLPLRFRDTNTSPQFLFHVPIAPWLQGIDFNLPSYQQNDRHSYRFMTQSGMIRHMLTFVNQSWDHLPTVKTGGHVRRAIQEKYNNFVHWSLLPQELVPPTFEKEGSPVVDDELAGHIEKDLTNPYNFPLMADYFANMPQGLVVVHEHDVLRDEGILYAQRLKQDGVDGRLYHDVTGYHGVSLHDNGPLAMDAAKTVTEAVIKYMADVLNINLNED